MKTQVPLLFGALLTVVAFVPAARAQATDPVSSAALVSPFSGTAEISTMRKQGAMPVTVQVTSARSYDGKISFSGVGAKGTRVEGTMVFTDDQRVVVEFLAKVLASPAAALPGERTPPGRKLLVKVRAAGTYAVTDPASLTFVISGNSGRGGGTNVKGAVTLSPSSELTITMESGFKQKIGGVGRKLTFRFVGAGAPPATP